MSWDPAKFGQIVVDFFGYIERNPMPDLYQAFELLTLDSLGKILFGFDFQAIQNPSGERVTTYFTAFTAATDSVYIFAPILDYWPLGQRAKGHRAVERFRTVLGQVAKDKAREIKDDSKNLPREPSDLLTVFVQAWIENQLSLEEILDEMTALLIAGHDTTANALSCVVYLLAKHPEIQVRVREEVKSAFSNHTTGQQIPSADEIKSLKYLDAVIKEALRLYPSTPILPTRRTAKDTQLGNIPIPAGTLITVNLHAMHRYDKYWADPHIFNPERWLSLDDQARNKIAWSAFTGGERICVGKGFATTELRVVLSMLIRKYSLHLPEDSVHKERIQFCCSILLKPRNLRVQFRPYSE
ncbi:hypothetical protein K7432_008190 [Basidiobolus ranarum]|uniref:Cytochrome P450 n=1 Tax=Basidiobolus ranarum TaxID=34480 RepID=A0ABR2WSB4_9FUNG